MKVLKKPLILFAILPILAFVFALLSLGPAVPKANAAKVCPEIKPGNPVASDLAPNPDKVREEREIPRSCEGKGVINEVLCAISELFANLSGPGKLGLKDSQMPGYLRTANELALSGDEEALLDPEKREEPGAVTGGIAKMLIPGYTQNGLDPIKELTESEKQVVPGTITLNNQILQKTIEPDVYEEPEVDPDKKGYYDLQIGTGGDAVSNYKVQGRFGEIAPLYDRYGFLKQALMPSARKVTIPDDDCIEYDLSGIAVTGFAEENPNRTAPWQAFREIPDEDREGQTEECSQDEEGNVISCPTESEGETYKAGGNLDTQSEVALVDEAWERIGAPSNNPGEGGVFNILLPPGTSFRTDQAETQLSFDYKPHSDLADYSDGSNLKIAEIGNVGGAVDCMVNGLTAHPASANSRACDNAFGAFGFSIVCTDEATPLGFSNESGSGTARRAWDIVNRLYQGFWCLWNWDKDGEFAYIFDEEAFRQEPNPPYPLPASHSGNLFWCTELARRSRNDLGLSVSSRTMAKQFGAATEAGGPSSGRWITIGDSTYQNIKPGAVIFFSSRTGPYYPKMNHVGVVYSVDKYAMKIVQSNSGTKDMDIPVLDNGKISPTIGNWEIRGFGKP